MVSYFLLELFNHLLVHLGGYSLLLDFVEQTREGYDVLSQGANLIFVLSQFEFTFSKLF